MDQGPRAVSTSQIINSCTWGLKLLSATLTIPWKRSLLYYSQPIFSKETILTSYLLQTCLIRPGEAGIRGLQTFPAKVIRDPREVNMSTVVRTREYFYGENDQDLRTRFLPSKSKPLQSGRRRYIAFVSANLPNNPSSPFLVCAPESLINLMRMTPSFPQEQI